MPQLRPCHLQAVLAVIHVIGLTAFHPSHPNNNSPKKNISAAIFYIYIFLLFLHVLDTLRDGERRLLDFYRYFHQYRKIFKKIKSILFYFIVTENLFDCYEPT